MAPNQREPALVSAQSPAVAATVPEPQHPNKRSWEKEALIIGGTAGAGAAIGAIAGGGKGAGIGAATRWNWRVNLRLGHQKQEVVSREFAASFGFCPSFLW
jgi:hypothetical protein